MTDFDMSSSVLDGFCQPHPFIAQTVDQAPNSSGVHIVWGPGSEDGVVYVGQTGNLRDRLRQHLSGGRQSSVLHKQVGQLLDQSGPASASRDAIREWLADCRVAWVETTDDEAVKGDLVDAFNPRFNQLRTAPASAGS